MAVTAPASAASYSLEDAENDITTLRSQVDALTEVIQQMDGALIPNSPAAAYYTQYCTAGHMKYVSGADGANYATGRNTQAFSGTQSITSGTSVAIGNLTFTVDTGTYEVDGVVVGAQGATADPWELGFVSTATVSAVMIAYFCVLQLTNETVTVNQINSGSALTFFSPACPLGDSLQFWFHGWVTFSSSGTFSASGGTDTTTWTAHSSIMRCCPVI